MCVCGCHYCWFVICSKDVSRNGCFVCYNYLHHSFCLISHMRDVFIIICTRIYMCECGCRWLWWVLKSKCKAFIEERGNGDDDNGDDDDDNSAIASK